MGPARIAGRWAFRGLVAVGLLAIAVHEARRGLALRMELRSETLPPGADGNLARVPPLSTAALDAFGRPATGPGIATAMFLVREESVIADLRFWQTVRALDPTLQISWLGLCAGPRCVAAARKQQVGAEPLLVVYQQSQTFQMVQRADQGGQYLLVGRRGRVAQVGDWRGLDPARLAAAIANAPGLR